MSTIYNYDEYDFKNNNIQNVIFKINNIKHTYSALLPDYFKRLLKSKRLRFSN